MDWLKCNICFNTYNDSSLRPRSLSCGHTFCEKCLDNTIQNKTLTCPQCRKVLEINSVVDFPINFVLEGLLKSLNPCSHKLDASEGALSRPIEREGVLDEKHETYGDLKSILEQQQKSLSAQKELLRTSAGMCNEHSGNELIFRCSSHKCWVCEKCIDERGDHPKRKCSIIFFKEEIENRKQEHKIYFENEEKCCDETVLEIEKHISYLREKREHHISLVEALQDLVTLHKKEDTNLQGEIASFEKIIVSGKSAKQILLDAKKTALNAETLDESNAARDMMEHKKSDAANWVKNSKREVDEGKLKVKTSTYCELATKKSLEYQQKCGFYQEELDGNLNQSEINESLEKMMNLIDLEISKKNASEIAKATFDKICKAHHESIEHWCFKCKRWLCVHCLNFHTELTECDTSDVSEGVEYIKEEHKESINWILSIFEKNTNRLIPKIKNHDDIIEEITVKKKELEEQFEKHAKEKTELQNLLKQAKQIKEHVNKFMDLLDSTNTPNEIMDNTEILAEMKQEVCSWSLTNLGIDIPHDRHDVAKALEEEKNVYVDCVIKNEEENDTVSLQHGRLSLHDGQLYMHKFMDQTIEDGNTVIPFNCLMRNLAVNPDMVFIELSLEGKVKGKIIVQLHIMLPNIRRNFVNIVTGQLGKSLAGLKCDQNSNNALWINALPFCDMKVKPYNRGSSKAKRGDIVGFYGNGYLQQLFFHIDEHTWSYSYLKVFGSIVNGLEVLQECYDSASRDTVITDCGLVLPREFE